MFNLGFSELILLGVIALVFIGPKQLPELARTVGRLLNELKRASSDFQQSFTEPMKEELMHRIEESRAQNADPDPDPDPEPPKEHQS
jgi:sec-independent protein translocase protein TatB